MMPPRKDNDETKDPSSEQISQSDATASNHSPQQPRQAAFPPATRQALATSEPASSYSSNNAEVDVDELQDSRRSLHERTYTQARASPSVIPNQRDLAAIVDALDPKEIEAIASRGKPCSERTLVLKKLPQHGGGSHCKPGAYHAPPPSRATSHSKNRQQPQDNSSKKERDAAAEDEELSPVLLRHLAEEQQPGAFPSSRRPLNLRRQEVGGSNASLSSFSGSLPPATTSPASQSTQLARQQSSSLDSAHASVAGPLPIHTNPVQPQSHPVIEASLVSSQPIDGQGGPSQDLQDDVERPSQTQAQTQQPPAAVHRSESQEEAHSTSPADAILEAQDAGIKDFMQNRTFCLFLMGYICAIVTIAILAVTGIVLQRELKKAKSGSASDIPIPLKHTKDIQITLDTAAVIVQEYIDPIYNPAQYDAFRWLISHPNLPEFSHKRRVQLYALTAFYFSLHFRDWPTVDRTYIMSQILPECEWNEKYKIELCTKVEDPENGEEFGVLQQLNLTGSEREGYIVANVHGALPPEVAMLRSLETIHIGFTDLNADLEDMLPWQLESLLYLSTLDYGGNRLQSTIPTRIARLQGLTWLSLQSNRLSSSIPSELGTMTHLTTLQLQDNQLDGGIPTELGNLVLVQDLALRNNALVGNIPSHLGRLQRLTSLTLQKNMLSGDGGIPSQIGLLTNLETLSLWGNEGLAGPLPSELGLLGGTLRHLDLHSNSFRGTLPTELGLLTRLERFLVHGNDGLTGPVPAGLCSNQGLTKFQVDCLRVDCDPDACNCSCYGF